jgi:hypothetical protein
VTNQKDIAKKQAEIVGQLQQFPIGRTNSGGRAGGMVEVVVTNPLPGQPSVVQAKCANDCPPGNVQLLKADDGSYVALSPNAAQSTGVTTTRQVSKKDPKKPQKDEEVWPCTVAFLYSRIKPNTEDLTDNGATDITSYDYLEPVYAGTVRSEGYGQRFDELGDFETAEKALADDYKDNRKLKPGQGGSGGAGDNAAWGSGSADAVRVWFYIGDPIYLEEIARTTKIFNVTGTPSHPLAGDIQDSGPGYCLVIREGLRYSAIFPHELIGEGPITKEVKKQFPDLGGRIGYWGGITKWGGVKDYVSSSRVSYFRNGPTRTEIYQAPTSFPSTYIPEVDPNPWMQQNVAWFQFGWGSEDTPMYIGAICSSHVNVESSVFAGLGCGETVPPDSWFWAGSGAPYYAVLDKYIQGWDGRSNLMYVCWEGHKDNINLAQSFFEALKTYWGLPGSVTQLAICGRYGCPIGDPGGGGGYPSAPPPPPRFIIKSFGRKAEVWLKVCKGNDPPLEIKLPFEFAAILERTQIMGNATYSSGGGVNFRNTFYTYATSRGTPRNQLLENPHATLSIDKDFAYINISYGAERIWEDPLTYPIKLVKETSASSVREVGTKPTAYNGIVGEYVFTSFGTNWQTEPRYEKDCFSYCQSYKIKLPTTEDKTLTIVASQRYRRGEIITLTANSPDTEFDQKYLIVDFKTERYENIPLPPGVPVTQEIARWTTPSPDHASFGGLPALIQFPFIGAYDASQERHIPVQYMPKFYKPQSNWTKLDWVHFQLQEKPRLFLPMNEVLSPQVFVSRDTSNHPVDVIFDLDGKFGRNGRAEKISHSSAFGSASTPSQGYTTQGYLQHQYPLFLSFKEQLIGNGLLKDGQLTNWYRVSTTSFPIMGQVKRNPPPD